jgi:hypothetical protein
MLRRFPLAPPLVAAACWCASGQITLPDAAGAERLAIPASPGVAVAVFALAWLVPGWRRHPATALPALLSTIPWWPMPLPAIALIWTGPLAWAPILASLLAAWLSTRAAAGDDRRVLRPAHHALFCGALTLALAVLTAWIVSPRLPGGDEPHYLVITQSLLRDGDLEIGNNHAARDYAAFFPGELRPDYRQAGRRGEIYSVHAPGVPVLVLPGFALAGYRGAQVTIIVLAAATAALCWWIGWLLTSSARAAWFAALAIVGTPTFLVQSVTIFPDGPGAFASACALWLIVSLARRETVALARLLSVSAALASLPWLHTRFAVIAIVAGAVIAGQLLHARRRRDMIAFAVIPIVSAAAWFAFFQALYGTFNPAAPYGPASGDRSWTFIPGGMLGLLFDQQFGIAAYSPVLLAAGVGVAGVWRGHRAIAVAIASAGTMLAYLAGSATYWMWWAGVPAPPARLVTAVLPCVAVALAVAWTRLTVPGRVAATAALAWSLSMAVIVLGVGRGALAWNVRDAQALWLEWLAPVVNLPRGFPSFFWQLTPAVVSTEWPFALHVGAWASVLLTGAAITVRLARRPRASGAIATTLVCGCLIVLVVAVQAGWWLNNSAGLDPTRSQLAAIAAMQQGRAAYLIDALRVSRAGGLPGVFVVRPAEAPRFRPELPPVFFDDVPAGTYELRVLAAEPPSGSMTIRTTASREPLAVVELRPLLEQSVTVEVPEGTRRLSIDAPASLSISLRR